MISIADDIADLVEQLVDAGIPATGDPREAVNAPGAIVLVEPPTRDYVQLAQTWQLSVVLVTTDTGLATTKALGDVVELLAEKFPIEEARPGARRLSLDRPAVPAYFCTLITP